MTDLAIIAAVDRNRGIGVDCRMPWHVSEDLKNFKRITQGGAVVMGRKTYDSIGKALVNRDNYVLTRNKDLKLSDATTLHDYQSVVDLAEKENKQIFIIGGGEIYSLFLNVAVKIYLSELQTTIANVDTYFPEIDDKDYIIEDETEVNAEIPYIYRVLIKKKKPTL